jgi:DICT domain-containing protein
MELREVIRDVEERRKTVTVVGADPAAAADLRGRFADRNVAVETAEADADPSGYAVVSDDGEFLDAFALSDSAGERRDRVSPLDEVAYEPVLDHLEETLFTSYDTSRMLAASREIEDRAWRAGAGRLYAGFQRFSVLAEQLSVYDRLGGETDLEVRAFAAPDEALPDHGGNVTVHSEDVAEIRETWFVAYDGAGVDERKCVLLAEEREPGEFYGFWSYDPETVGSVFDRLDREFVPGRGGDAERPAGSPGDGA